MSSNESMHKLSLTKFNFSPDHEEKKKQDRKLIVVRVGRSAYSMFRLILVYILPKIFN